VILAAAKVGGIGANSTYPADFIYINLAIATNVIHSAYMSGVKRLLNLGSSCIYPKLAPQPLKEEYLLTGPLEPSNEAYAVAKIAAIRLCKHYNEQYGTDFVSAMPTNMYGTGDNYDAFGSHVLPALIRKFHFAKTSGIAPILWGDGTPYREFLHADDCADAVVFLMESLGRKDIGDIINIGSGEELRIHDIANLVAQTVGFRGEIRWDPTKPNGTPRKILDSSKMSAMGWAPSIGLKEGVAEAYRDFLQRGRDGGKNESQG
ncbi:MAG: GDP-L-fucose synthase, partial [Bacillota bacterium]|nr:GDP-L-fucose synthase [Bacillota bacterium]